MHSYLLFLSGFLPLSLTRARFHPPASRHAKSCESDFVLLPSVRFHFLPYVLSQFHAEFWFGLPSCVDWIWPTPALSSTPPHRTAGPLRPPVSVTASRGSTTPTARLASAPTLPRSPRASPSSAPSAPSSSIDAYTSAASRRAPRQTSHASASRRTCRTSMSERRSHPHREKYTRAANNLHCYYGTAALFATPDTETPMSPRSLTTLASLPPFPCLFPASLN